MPGDLNLAVAAAAFVLACAALVGIGLFVLSLILKAQARHRRRLGRVGRRRMSGTYDLDEVRLQLLRRKDDGSLAALAERLATFVPLLDTQRLKANIRRGGLKLSIPGFVMIAAVVGAVITVAGMVGFGLSPALAAVPGMVLGMLLVDLFVKLRGEMMAERFMKQLPNALDTIIRGVRAGLPVLECIVNVGQEFDDPVGGHFRTISERVQLGESLDVALWRAAQVIDRPEMDFMAICISIQMETGGSLAEALTNLSNVLRDREKMKLKIKAISSEAKMSAVIIGAMPFVMLVLLSMMSPDYVAPLFFDSRGHWMLAAGLSSISLGAIVMWRMTKFEI